MKAVLWRSILYGGIAIGLLGIVFPPAFDSWSPGRPAPAFTHSGKQDWINSPPLTLSSLRGQVVLIDFWTSDCWNCYRSFPWLNEVDRKYSAVGLQIIGVHSPEFRHERDRARVADKVKEFGLDHPTMIDNDFSYWKAIGNQYWPAYYLIDKRGMLRYRFVGETHSGSAQARAIEQRIEALLAEEG